jgi:hypothetical protein
MLSARPENGATPAGFRWHAEVPKFMQTIFDLREEFFKLGISRGLGKFRQEDRMKEEREPTTSGWR